jgi:hypothetical protein
MTPEIVTCRLLYERGDLELHFDPDYLLCHGLKGGFNLALLAQFSFGNHKNLVLGCWQLWTSSLAVFRQPYGSNQVVSRPLVQ